LPNVGRGTRELEREPAGEDSDAPLAGIEAVLIDLHVVVFETDLSRDFALPRSMELR